MASIVRRDMDSGFHAVYVENDGQRTAYAALRPVGSEDETALAACLARFLKESGTSIIKCDVFGPCDRYKAFTRALEGLFPPPGFPVTWVEGLDCSRDSLAGILVRSVAGPVVETVCLDAVPVARVWEDGVGRYCLAGGIHSNAFSALPGQQTQLTLEKLEAALNAAGMDTTNIVRTWFYNDQLLDWYSEFNAVRTRFYRERGIFNRLLPASTGIGGKNPYQAALVAGAEAIVFKHRNASVREAISPLQNQAFGYGSAFSRAVEVERPGERRLLVSGTASINEAGETVCKGDIDGQIGKTMVVVEALLSSSRMEWSDVVRAIAYMKHPAGAAAFSRFLQSSAAPDLPWIVPQNDICRHDLLFEIEVDAVKVS